MTYSEIFDYVFYADIFLGIAIFILCIISLSIGIIGKTLNFIDFMWKFIIGPGATILFYSFVINLFLWFAIFK